MRILESSRNRLKPYFESAILRRMFGATHNRLDAMRFMREGKIVLLNLAPGNRLSSQLSDAIGALILNEVLATARALPRGVRYPTYLVLDEFQNFVGPDIEAALPEVRQLGLRLLLSHQSLSQLKRGDYDLTSMIFQAQSRLEEETKRHQKGAEDRSRDSREAQSKAKVERRRPEVGRRPRVRYIAFREPVTPVGGLCRSFSECGGKRLREVLFCFRRSVQLSGNRMATSLRLAVDEYKDIDHYRWLLTDGQGNVLARHEVALDSRAMEHGGYLDLAQWVADYRDAFETAELLHRMGDWIGANVFGELRQVFLDELRHSALLAVNVCLSQDALELAQRPFEIAHLAGTFLVERGVRFIYQDEGMDGVVHKSAGKELRVLCVFSLPTSQSPLNLRRERHALKRLLESIGRRLGVGIDLRTIQYGATRRVLEDAIDEGEGWDIIHFSGHGAAGFVILEQESGEEDVISAKDLAGMLEPSKDRLKLVTLSACSSGASHEEARRWLDRSPPPPTELDSAPELVNLAHGLARDLSCAVLGMRFTVDDHFAVRLAEHLYPLLLEKRQALPRALQRACEKALTPELRSRAPLSMFTPILFGRLAGTLAFTVPSETTMPERFLARTGLFGFPPEPARFVGRLLPMLRASRALAPQSEWRGVLFHGMAGAGKTTCALELAYRHEQRRFGGYVFFRCPEEGAHHRATLSDFLHAIENQLDKERGSLTCQCSHPEDFQERLVPRIADLVGRESVLILLDNLEGLLNREGEWLDPRWAALVDTMLCHSGDSRLVMTARRVPASLARDNRTLRVPIHALTFAESVLLAGELSNLSELSREGQGRELLLGLLTVIQGHPKLLEMADKLATRPGQLRVQVEGALAEARRGGAPLRAFLDSGESQQDERHFIRALHGWTESVSAGLTGQARLLFTALCRMEEGHRQDSVLNALGPLLLECVGRFREKASSGEVVPEPDIEGLLKELESFGLVERSRMLVDTEQGPHFAVMTFAIHPAVAEVQLSSASKPLLNLVDTLLGDWFCSIAAAARATERHGHGEVVVEAARSAVPYLLRAQRWEIAANCLWDISLRDRTPGGRTWLMLIARTLLERLQDSRANVNIHVLLANALRSAGGAAEAEQMLLEMIQHAEKRADHVQCLVPAGALFYVLLESGRLEEALHLADRKIEWGRSAGLGPWARLSDEVQRLQVLNALGRHAEVHHAVGHWRAQAQDFPARGEKDGAEPWKVLETLLHTGVVAAVGLGAWESAFDLNNARLESERRRGAADIELHRIAFDSFAPLYHLGRRTEAVALLHECRNEFDQRGDFEWLAKACSNLGVVEGDMGRIEAAVGFDRVAAKYRHLIRQPTECAITHRNLGLHLKQLGRTEEALAHLLAAALISFQTASGRLQDDLACLHDFTAATTRPTFDKMAAEVDKTEGVRFRSLFEDLPRRAPTGDAALAAVWQMAEDVWRPRELALDGLPPEVLSALKETDPRRVNSLLRAAFRTMEPEERRRIAQRLDKAGVIRVSGPPSLTEERLRVFDPLLQAIANVAKRETAESVRRAIEGEFDALEYRGWWLSDESRRIWNGERDLHRLTAGLDNNSAFLVRRILELSEKPRMAGFNRDKNLGDIWISLPLEVRLAFRGKGAESQRELEAALAKLPEKMGDEVCSKLVELGLMGPGSLPSLRDLDRFAPLFEDIARIALAEAGDELRKDVENALLYLENGGWQVVEPIRALWRGETDLETLTEGIEVESKQFVARAVMALQRRRGPSPE